jgi:hypothetical protein
MAFDHPFLPLAGSAVATTLGVGRWSFRIAPETFVMHCEFSLPHFNAEGKVTGAPWHEPNCCFMSFERGQISQCSPSSIDLDQR